MAIQIVYDGECPFCSRYVAMVRLRAALGDVELVNAREDHPAVRQLREAGFDLNAGMALIDGPKIYFGAECIHRLALMSTRSTLFNRLNAFVFRSATLSRWLYPVMRTGRNATLVLLGRRRISAPQPEV
ncbi:MAG: DCC1-like thiol-disulfide oxidoreductase family protein [Pseudomonadota bacterium]